MTLGGAKNMVWEENKASGGWDTDVKRLEDDVRGEMDGEGSRDWGLILRQAAHSPENTSRSQL
jgi:hypothetical protein